MSISSRQNFRGSISSSSALLTAMTCHAPSWKVISIVPSTVAPSMASLYLRWLSPSSPVLDDFVEQVRSHGKGILKGNIDN